MVEALVEDFFAKVRRLVFNSVYVVAAEAKNDAIWIDRFNTKMGLK